VCRAADDDLGARDRHAGGADLGEALLDELGLDRLRVQLLQSPSGVAVIQAADLGQHRLWVFVAGPESLEVEHAEPAQLADRDRHGRAHDGVHRRREHRDLEGEGVDRPADRHVLRVAGAATRHHGDVVEGVRPASALGAPDLDVAHPPTLPARRHVLTVARTVSGSS
jgi:hypothetical protein